MADIDGWHARDLLILHCHALTLDVLSGRDSRDYGHKLVALNTGCYSDLREPV
jgi:hypothetical protein